MPVDSLIGETSPPSPKQSLSTSIDPEYTLYFTLPSAKSLLLFLPKGAFYIYYKILILFDDRHLTQCL